MRDIKVFTFSNLKSQFPLVKNTIPMSAFKLDWWQKPEQQREKSDGWQWAGTQECTGSSIQAGSTHKVPKLLLNSLFSLSSYPWHGSYWQQTELLLLNLTTTLFFFSFCSFKCLFFPLWQQVPEWLPLLFLSTWKYFMRLNHLLWSDKHFNRFSITRKHSCCWKM